MDRATINRLFRLSKREVYSHFDFTLSLCHLEKKGYYYNCITKEWFDPPKKGKSQLPKKMHKSHFRDEISDIIVLLHRGKRSVNAHEFEEWMYFFIQVIYASQQYLDWATIISDQLDDMIRGFVVNRSFYMSSYLFYVRELAGDLGQRVSPEAFQLVTKYDNLFI